MRSSAGFFRRSSIIADEVRTPMSRTLSRISAIRFAFSGPSGQANDEQRAGQVIRPALESRQMASIDAEQLGDDDDRQGPGDVTSEVEVATTIEHLLHEVARDREHARLHHLRDARGRERLTHERADAGVIRRIVDDERADGWGSLRHGNERHLRRKYRRVAKYRVDITEAHESGDIERKRTPHGSLRTRGGEDLHRVFAKFGRAVLEGRKCLECERWGGRSGRRDLLHR